MNTTPIRSRFPIPGELCSALDRLLSSDSASAPQPIWPETIARIAESLHTSREAIAPFIDAWSALYTVTLYLDHLQDGDPLGDAWLEAQPPAIQYHLAFSLYLAAQHALAQLDDQAIPAQRIVRLQGFWATSVAQLASGQYLDLSQAPGDHSLDRYERIAAQKTGAAFALAFGGAALLASDDEAVIAALTNAGTVYGMLLQYRDDLSDRPAQSAQPDTPTFHQALLAAHPKLAVHPQEAGEAFWAATYASYSQALERILAPLPAAISALVMAFLRQSFGDAPAPAHSR